MKIGEYDFNFLQELIPEKNADGTIRKFSPQDRYYWKDIEKLNPHGEGLFCKFKINAEEISCVYAWVCDGNIIYIGETENLKKRFNTGYGNISPKNCYIGGQPTNCKMNKVLLEYAESCRKIDLYYYKTEKHKIIEKKLIKLIKIPICTRVIKEVK